MNAIKLHKWQEAIRDFACALQEKGYTVTHDSGGFSSVYMTGPAGTVRISNHMSDGLPGQKADHKLVYLANCDEIRRQVFDINSLGGWELVSVSIDEF